MHLQNIWKIILKINDYYDCLYYFFLQKIRYYCFKIKYILYKIQSLIKIELIPFYFNILLKFEKKLIKILINYYKIY